MSRIFITGSADGLGLLSAKSLMDEGHEVVLHARNENRRLETLENFPKSRIVLTGDLSKIEETKQLADEVNALGRFDAIIHNAGVYQAPGKLIFAVNTLAPYILTSLIHKPKRLVYLSSNMHLQGNLKLEHFGKESDKVTYSDSKLHVLMLAKAVARHWDKVLSNAVDPGWVPTKMGGKGAPDDLEKGYQTQVWLAVSNEEDAKVSGSYFHHQKEGHYNPTADDIELQDQFLSVCVEITGIEFPKV